MPYKIEIYEICKICFCNLVECFLITKIANEGINIRGFFDIFYKKQTYTAHILVHF